MFYFILIVVLIFAVAFIAVAASTAADSDAASKKGDAVKAIPGFSVSASYFGGQKASGIAIDETSRRIAVVHGTSSPNIYQYDQILAVEATRDGMSLTKTNRGSQVAGAAVGAVLLGPVGLLLGGLTGSSRQVDKVRKLSLKIYTKDMGRPMEEVVFFNSDTAISADSEGVKSFVYLMDSWYARLRAVVEGAV